MSRCALCEVPFGPTVRKFAREGKWVCLKCRTAPGAVPALASPVPPPAPVVTPPAQPTVPPPPLPCDHFFTKAVGVSFKNSDNTSRQKVIRGLQRGQRIQLLTGTNKKFPDAVALATDDGRQFGNLDAHTAADVMRGSEAGARFACFVANTTGGGGDKPIHGCNLVMFRAPVGVEQRAIEAYINQQMPAILAERYESAAEYAEPRRVYRGEGGGIRSNAVWYIVAGIAIFAVLGMVALVMFISRMLS